ncbi:tRNA lysidine(34) synthetase TilS [Parapedobacter sp. SGR-10]|uniref:tRNA lysidine(34) synthetase TilS n=1 Tax=Parapedobacter sp. SGR-10 TaxID=2710879 RepID=UPI0013D8190B|nr:tRNA lysidine(34) synthetase TilS [Parapedobacter sp. SGR-10]NGF56851.1 tRNA lysidine(34) synthetase TilS [Parapedobacter sp. SGR-10]
MELLKRFKAFCEKNHLWKTGDRILLAVSGGKDSMLMLRLFHDLKIDIEVVHCNFGLRGEESDKDELLVREYCGNLGIPHHVQRFDTEDYATTHKLSIQMAARELRYAWFERLAGERNCTAIAVAQHKNDHVETVLLNLVRGTGLQGLRGILPKRGNIIRPLLFLESKEIEQAVAQWDIPYRDDASNFSTKYARNKIRLDIIPQFEQLNADFIPIMNENISRFQETYAVLQNFVHTLRQQLFVVQKQNQWTIHKADIQDKDTGLLFLLFEPFGFSKSVLEDLKDALDSEPGRIFESPSHGLLLDRDQLILQEKSNEIDELTIHEGQQKIHWAAHSFELSVSEDRTIVKDRSTAKLDITKLVFPLTVRAWREGDYFQPLGMQGKKKLSDFFIDRKINLFEKKRIPIWVNGNGDILWISGFQIDERYKITENTQKVLTLVRHKL